MQRAPTFGLTQKGSAGRDRGARPTGCGQLKMGAVRADGHRGACKGHGEREGVVRGHAKVDAAKAK